MAFPEDPLGLRVEVKAGTWLNITGRVYTRDPITHTRGIRQGGATADPASVPLTINNRAGYFSPRNPMSPLYGLIGRNTPVRLSVPTAAHYLSVPIADAACATTPSASALQITGDIDVRVDFTAATPADWTELVGKYVAAGGQRSWRILLDPDGFLWWGWSPDGTSTALVQVKATAPLTRPDQRQAVRVTLDVDNGSGGRTVTFYTAPTLTGPWTQLGDTVTAVGTTSLYASTAPLTIGGIPGLAFKPGELRLYRAEVRSGIGGTAVANPDFTALPAGTTSFADPAGRSWTVQAPAEVRDRVDLFVGEVASWPQKWVASGADAWTPVEAAGILRRFGRGEKALDSTLRRRIPSGKPIAYWPMEEDQYATRAYSPIKGVRAAALTDVEWAALSSLPSSQPLPRIKAGAQLSAIAPTSSGGQWQVEIIYNADDKPPATEAEPWVDFIGVSTTGTVRRWVASMRAGSVRLYGFDASGTDIIFRSVAVGSDIYHGWVRLRLWVRETAGTCEWQISFQDVGGDAGSLGDTYSGTAGRVSAVTGTWPAAYEGWGIGHLAVLPTAQSSLYSGSDDGYAGETAWQRIQRLAAEESIPLSRIVGPLPPQRMGPQRPQTLLNLLQEAADADGGMLVESRDRLGLTFRDRSSLYTQEPRLVLDYAAGQIAAGSLEPVDDDSMVRNDVTMTREGGSSARATLETGPLSVQAPPDGIGLYDESVTVNTEDDLQLEYIAPWRLHLRTYDGALYPSLTIRLHRHPELIEPVLALREGDIVRLTNLPPWVAYGPVDLILTGLSERLLPRTWEVTLTCNPGGPWMTAKADHPIYAKADSDGSELAAAIAAGDTALPVRTTAGPTWTEDPAEMPFDIKVGGEVIRVLAITAPVASVQTMTVQRSVNGVVKAHPAGTPVSLAYPAITPL